MSDWIIAASGTEQGARLALYLALFAALAHAVFGALQKGKHDPWLTRGAIDANYGLIAAPFALFVVPWPEPFMWPIFAGVFIIHLIYKFAQGMAYSYGSYTLVYPVVRGIGPLVTVILAGVFFAEHFTAVQWGGVAVLSLGILSLAALNLYRGRADPHNLEIALAWAVGAGIMVAAYTTFDAYGIRATANPFTFLAWFFMIDGIVFPFVAAHRWRGMSPRPAIAPLMLRGLIGAFVAFFSFGAIMLATRLDKVGEAAVLRETSPVFAALIGWFVLKETVGPIRALLMGLIALGAVLVEFGG